MMDQILFYLKIGYFCTKSPKNNKRPPPFIWAPRVNGKNVLCGVLIKA